MKLLWALSLLASASAAHAAAAQPKATVKFIDACTGAPTAVHTPNGTILSVRVAGLTPGSRVLVKAVVAPVSVGTEPDRRMSVQREKIEFREKFTSVGSDGVVSFQKPIEFSYKRPETVVALAERTWEASVNWAQAAPNPRGGTALSAIYVMEDPSARFYKIKSGEICRWEGPLSLASSYLFNEDRSEMTLSRQVFIDEDHWSDKGFNVGIVPDYAGAGQVNNNTPLFLQDKLDWGWLFAGMSVEHHMQRNSALMLQYSVAKGQGGYWTQRLSFRRVQVDEYALQRPKGCYVWNKMRSGLLDVGYPMTEFVIVPKGRARPKDALEFIEEIRPTVQSCPKFEEGFSYDDARVLDGSVNDMLLFYPSPNAEVSR